MSSYAGKFKALNLMEEKYIIKECGGDLDLWKVLLKEDPTQEDDELIQALGWWRDEETGWTYCCYV